MSSYTMSHLWAYAFICCVWTCMSYPINTNTGLLNAGTESKDKFLGHLQDWGYLAKEYSSKDLSDALKKYQRFFNLEVTGVVDEATKQIMNMPRCGMPDIKSDIKNRKRKRRYVTKGSKWHNKHNVTWQLENSNNDGIPDITIRRLMERAFKKWSDVADINFIEFLPPSQGGPHEGSSQIRIRFEMGEHGDGIPFDGKMGNLGHAFDPFDNKGLSGDIHFDDAENFTALDPPVNGGQHKFLWVAVHELGHALGLEHSEDYNAIMSPFYNHFPGDDFDLTDDDIKGIQSIYGKRGPETPDTFVTPDTTEYIQPDTTEDSFETTEDLPPSSPNTQQVFNPSSSSINKANLPNLLVIVLITFLLLC